MSFGFSPGDVIKLVEISTRVYIAFKDANDNSETQVEALVREFQNFARCLLELDELMKEFGRSMPFPVEDFKKTLDKCETSLKPYKENLVDRRMGISKMVWTIKYIGKEKELDGLRKLITGHYQALNLCLSFLQLRLNLESTKREQRLLLEPRSRAMSLGGQWFTNSTVSSSLPNTPLALPAPEDEHPLYKDWQMFNRWLKSEDERLAQELELTRPSRSSWGDTPRPAADGNAETANILYHLRREVEDAIMFEENRFKRTAMEKRSHLAPSDAMKQKVREMPTAPTRTYTLDTEHSGNFSRFAPVPEHMNDSVATLRQEPNTPSPKTTPMGSPEIEQEYFHPGRWSPGPQSPLPIQDPSRLSVSTTRSSISMESASSHVAGLGINTPGTTPEHAMSNPLHPHLSSAWMTPIDIGDGALQWTKLVRKVIVERKSSERMNGKLHVIHENQECDIHWRYREDTGITLRALYRSKKDGKPRVWTVQDFPATGPSIPLTTTIDGELSIDFPRGSFGRLDKQWTDIKYSFDTAEQSVDFQTLLYTNAGKDKAELLFDRPVNTISSDKHRPECRGRNLRLWKKSEMRLESSGPVWVDVLVILFYTSCLEEKGHWVEEPHYTFEWLSESTYKKDSDKLTLTFSKDSAKWSTDKIFSRRKSSQASNASENTPTSPTIAGKRKDSMEIPGITRNRTNDSIISETASIRSTNSIFGKKGASMRSGKLNCFGYSKLDIEFLGKKDRRAFLEVWKQYVKPLGSIE